MLHKFRIMRIFLYYSNSFPIALCFSFCFLCEENGKGKEAEQQQQHPTGPRPPRPAQLAPHASKPSASASPLPHQLFAFLTRTRLHPR